MKPTLALSLFVAFLCCSVGSTQAGPTGCKVSVVTYLKSGTVKKRVFRTKALSEAGCAEDAGLHTTNFFPPKIAKKEVEYQFGNGPAISLKEVP